MEVRLCIPLCLHSILLYCSSDDQNQLIVALDVESVVRVSEMITDWKLKKREALNKGLLFWANFFDCFVVVRSFRKRIIQVIRCVIKDKVVALRKVK